MARTCKASRPCAIRRCSARRTGRNWSTSPRPPRTWKRCGYPSSAAGHLEPPPGSAEPPDSWGWSPPSAPPGHQPSSRQVRHEEKQFPERAKMRLIPVSPVSDVAAFLKNTGRRTCHGSSRQTSS
jgi:hypothetical protein